MCVTYTIDSSFQSGLPVDSLTTVVLYFLVPTPKITENLCLPAKKKYCIASFIFKMYSNL